MQNRIIRIALALAGCILLTAGCIRRSDLGSDGTPIGFAAGSTLLRDDATKAGTLKTGNQFTTGDKIAVFGWHDAIGGFIFNDQPVELKSSGRWEYAPVQPWEWGTSGDFYDFLAIYPFRASAPLPSVVSSPRVIVSQSYSTSDQCDLMMGGVRRKEEENDRNRTVPFVFHHLCCAVRVLIYNDSQQKDFTLNAYSFQNVASQAVARVQIVDDAATFGWTEAQRSAATPVGGASGIGQTLSHGSSGPGYTGDADLLIPMLLTEELGTGTGIWPKLVVNFTKDGSAEAEELEVNLKDICRLDEHDVETQEPIQQWERGVLYTYKIHIKVDGGIVVHVVTTDWDVVEAETPGLLI